MLRFVLNEVESVVEIECVCGVSTHNNDIHCVLHQIKLAYFRRGSQQPGEGQDPLLVSIAVKCHRRATKSRCSPISDDMS